MLSQVYKCGFQGTATSTYPSTAAPPKIPSLMEDAGNILGRLSSLLGHIQSIADKLNGGQPRAIEDNAKTPEPVPSIRCQLDVSRALLGKIEDEVQAIDARL